MKRSDREPGGARKNKKQKIKYSSLNEDAFEGLQVKSSLSVFMRLEIYKFPCFRITMVVAIVNAPVSFAC